MHAIYRQTGQQCSLQAVVAGLISLRSLTTSSFKIQTHEGAGQAKKGRRRRRRDEKKRLKTFAEDAFGSGPQFFTKETDNSTSEKKDNATKTLPDNTATDEDRMWRQLLKHSRSSSEAARLRRAWHLWQSTIEASEQSYSSFTENQRDSSRTKDNTDAGTSTKYRNGGSSWGNNETTHTTEWFAAWEESFTSSMNLNFDNDYESFWKYGSRDDAQRQEAFARQQKRWQQAGDTQHSFNKGSVFGLSKEVRSNLSLLGLATTHLPSTSELKTAFRASAMAWHPDRHPDPEAASTAEEKFKQIQAAFAYLQAVVPV